LSSNGFRDTSASHGCIVPYEFANVIRIYDAVKTYIAAGKDDPVLEVIATGTDIDRQLRTA